MSSAGVALAGAGIGTPVAGQVGEDEVTVLDWLANAEQAVLGARVLLSRWGKHSVQWNPADDRCSVLALSTEPSPDGSWSFSGEVWEMGPEAATQ